MAIPDYPVLAFTTPAKLRTWLKKNHAKALGLRLRFFKKDSGKPTITYAQALDEALCFGWIDGISHKYDAESWTQAFTPRRKRSKWSKINQGHVARLIKAKRMQPAGQREIDAAKADGRWDQAYDSPKNMKVPADFLREVKKDKNAYAFYQRLNRTNQYAIAFRLATAKKPETRARRLALFVGMMAAGKKFY